MNLTYYRVVMAVSGVVITLCCWLLYNPATDHFNDPMYWISATAGYMIGAVIYDVVIRPLFDRWFGNPRGLKRQGDIRAASMWYGSPTRRRDIDPGD